MEKRYKKTGVQGSTPVGWLLRDCRQPARLISLRWQPAGAGSFLAVDVVFLLAHPDEGGALGQLLELAGADIGAGGAHAA